MQREILFRGKRIDNGEWVEGNLLTQKPGKFMEGAYICETISSARADCGLIALGGFIEVDPSTVGQYIGMDDCNGKRIYEGDVIKFADGYTDRSGDSVETVGFGAVCYDNECPMFYITDRTSIEMQDLWECTDVTEIIGNIHDNPYLLPEGTQC